MLPGNSFNFAYTYNTSTGMLETYEYPSGYKLKYLYDSRGNLLGMSNATTDQALWKAYSENQRGQLTEYSQANGVQTFNMFDQYGYLTQTNSVSFLKDIEHPIQNFGYSFDPATGNLLSRTDIERNLSESFAYDNTKERLASYTHAGVSTQLFYHENGNISKKGDVTSSSVGYTYGAKPHAVTGISNPTSAFVQQAQPQDISFTPFNKVALIRNSQAPKHQLAFTYGPDEQRMMSVLYTTDPSAPLMTKYYCEYYEKEVTATSVRELHYLHSPSGLFAIMVKQGTTETMYYTHNDHLGSLTAISDAAGNLVESLSYDPWGRRRNPDNWNDFNVSSTLFDRGFTGHEHLPQFGLINMNGRVYDPFLARFLSPDPFVQSPGNPQNYNRYSYALNNPLKYTDPSGYTYKPEDWDKGKGGATYINPYISSGYQGQMGVGSNNHWSDQYRDEYNFFVIGHYSSFVNRYGESNYMAGVDLYNNSVTRSWWQSGSISTSNISDWSYNPHAGEEVHRTFENRTVFISYEGMWKRIASNGTVSDISGGGAAQGGGGKLATWSFIAGAASLGFDSWQNLAYNGYTYLPSKGPNAGKLTSVWKMNKSGNFSLKNGSKIPNSANAASKLMVTKMVKIGGIALTTVGLGFTVYDVRQNGLNLSNGTDFVMGGVAYVPGWGWAVSGGYFIGKACYEVYPSIPADYWGRPGTGFGR
jgi:RHS repeat-associated protein